MSSVPVSFSQRTGFPVKCEFAEKTAYVESAEKLAAKFPDQWRLTVATQAAAREVKFLDEGIGQ